MDRDLLIELGTEEIPARFIEDIKADMKSFLVKRLKELRIDHNEVTIKSTPRRFAIFIKDLADRQTDVTEEVRGPKKAIAYGEDGTPTKALLGFLRSKGCDENDVYTKEDKDSEYIYVKKALESKKTTDYFEELIEDMVGSLSIARPMKWGASKVKFIRPIRRVMCLYSGSHVPVHVFGIDSQKTTFGHRFLGSDEIEIDTVDEYEKKLEENYCILDDDKRREMIREGIEKLAQSMDLDVMKDEGLLNEINYIVEYPTPLQGSFDEEYLRLPVEAIIVPMKEHQRYFPVMDRGGNLVNKFITVRNGSTDYIDNVRKGNEKVLDARLADAKFFYEEDSSKKLEEFLPRLETIIYHEKLGTMLSKAQRLVRIADEFAPLLEVDKESLLRSAKLAKADLPTATVTEFTELQGLMGGYFAKNSGESEKVSMAIREHYLPRFTGDDLPSTNEGVLLSLADRFDGLVGFYGAGIRPTGSQDPYALRRSAIGAISLLVESRVDASLSELIDKVVGVFKQSLELDYEKAKKDLIEFLKIRLKNMLLDEGIRYDVVDAVLVLEELPLHEICDRAKAIDQWLSEGNDDALNTFDRVINISKGEVAGEIDSSLFEEEEEKNLYREYIVLSEKTEDLMEEKKYRESLNEIVSKKNVIDSYFDKVMVNAEDDRIRKNRMAQIASLRDIILSLGDFSKISH